MGPRKILFVDVSPSPSYGGSKRVLTNIFSVIDRSRWMPHVLYYREGAYLAEVSAMGIWAKAPIGLPGRRWEGKSAPGSADSDQPPSGGSNGLASDLRSRVAAAGMRRDPSGFVERSLPRRVVRDLRSLHRYWIRGQGWARRLPAFLPSGVDLIHFNGPMHDQRYEWAHLARRLGVPFVTHEHGPWRIPPYAFRLVARSAAAVLCLTEERAEQIQHFCGGNVRTELVPNGVAVEKLTPRRDRDRVRRDLGVDPAAFLLITPAHIQAYKGQLLAIEAASRISREALNFSWVLCGAVLESDYLLSIRRRIQELGLEKKITILDERGDLPDLLAAADLLVHTSIGPEAFGMVVVEAMGVGIPVVGPAEGAVASIVRDRQDGLLYEARNAEAMAEAILRLSRSPEERKAMGESGRLRVIESFSLHAQVQKLCAVYERALREGTDREEA